MPQFRRRRYRGVSAAGVGEMSSHLLLRMNRSIEYGRRKECNCNAFLTFHQIGSMTDPQHESARPSKQSRTGDPPAISSAELLGGRREIVIHHGKEQYRLRLTNSNKLILVK
jgi:hemin uptake protein HemP